MRTEASDLTYSGNIDDKPQFGGWFWQDVKADQSQAGLIRKERGRNAGPSGGTALRPLAACVFLALFPCILVLSGCSQQAASAAKPVAEAPLEVSAVHPHRGEVYRFINLPGEVRPLYEVTLFAKVDGYLETLRVDKGDSVKAGDLIANIDVPELRASLVKYEAELELAQAEFKETNEPATNNATYVRLPQSDSGKTRPTIAGGKLAVAQANVQYTKAMLKYARVTAPFDGIITRRYVDPGAYIPAPNAADTPQAAAIVNLTDFKTLRLQVAVPETEATHIEVGQPVRWSTDSYPGQHFDGTVTRAYWALDKATKTMLTETQMANPGMKLRPGMLVNARIGVEKKDDALLLPVEAVVREKTNSFAFIFSDGKAKKVAIETGFSDGKNVKILGGVKPSDLAIVAGKQTVRDGQLVKVTETK